ncbi:hypothetical protein ASG35_06615 [Burkholderia sp. Leaf177]|uniref:PhaM family polyhydroxyalkanoate granule multifunctional regulatory protein n=1 Tax=Burkholderia sp. Leaf177 TaxID=1736287 RepID=UPI0006FC83CA|nr:PhaM family polyhydroxyalkanoate granule multifunctional regulatory protein [Burkholderia sp. Leaf177]KQR79564.1 hypothetical protein ASG35_06615 [Burkholderia sp. Leaf177]
MTDTPGGTPPFGSFPGMSGFPQGDMMEKMWDMMKMNPFAAVVSPGGSPSLSMMSDMLAPLTNVEELDKRIKDMRAVEQWLKLNLNMLQSAIQALEVQRATLATLRAFGAYAQSSVDSAKNAGAANAASASAGAWPAPPLKEEQPAPDSEATDETGAHDASFDPAGWWNMLQSQFNNLATLAMAQQPGPAEATSENAEPPKAAAPKAPRKTAAKKAAAPKTAAKKKPL